MRSQGSCFLYHPTLFTVLVTCQKKMPDNMALADFGIKLNSGIILVSDVQVVTYNYIHY